MLIEESGFVTDIEWDPEEHSQEVRDAIKVMVTDKPNKKSSKGCRNCGKNTTTALWCQCQLGPVERPNQLVAGEYAVCFVNGRSSAIHPPECYSTSSGRNRGPAFVGACNLWKEMLGKLGAHDSNENTSENHLSNDETTERQEDDCNDANEEETAEIWEETTERQLNDETIERPSNDETTERQEDEDANEEETTERQEDDADEEGGRQEEDANERQDDDADESMEEETQCPNLDVFDPSYQKMAFIHPGDLLEVKNKGIIGQLKVHTIMKVLRIKEDLTYQVCRRVEVLFRALKRHPRDMILKYSAVSSG